MNTTSLPSNRRAKNRRHVNVDFQSSNSLACDCKQPSTTCYSSTEDVHKPLRQPFHFFPPKYAVPCPHAAHDPSFVSAWLTYIDLPEYIPKFYSHSVTPTTLLSLTSKELQTIGVMRLIHRRYILSEIQRQKNEAIPTHMLQTTPEHGRILNHLTVEQFLLSWLRFAVIMLTSAVVSIRLPSLDSDSAAVDKYFMATSLFMALLAVVVTLYALRTFSVMVHACDYPIKYTKYESDATIPSILVFTVTSVTLYALLAHKSTEEAAILVLTFL